MSELAVTIDLLDALDFFLDAVRDSGIAPPSPDPLGEAYWAARQQVDAWRDFLQPPAIYPVPAPVENCPHPYDRDWAFLYTDLIDGADYIVRCCNVCGNVDRPGRVSPNFKKKKKSKKKATPVAELEPTP